MRLTGEAPASRSALGDYRRSASAVLNDGAFNVNSTSVEAWAAFLASAKRIAVATWPATGPSADANARFPRAAPTGSEPIATGAYNEPTKSNWTGFINLSDAQLRYVASTFPRTSDTPAYPQSCQDVNATVCDALRTVWHIHPCPVACNLSSGAAIPASAPWLTTRSPACWRPAGAAAASTRRDRRSGRRKD